MESDRPPTGFPIAPAAPIRLSWGSPRACQQWITGNKYNKKYNGGTDRQGQSRNRPVSQPGRFNRWEGTLGQSRQDLADQFRNPAICNRNSVSVGESPPGRGRFKIAHNDFADNFGNLEFATWGAINFGEYRPGGGAFQIRS